jgi:hypothetical protein
MAIPNSPLINVRLWGAMATDSWSTGFWLLFGESAVQPTQAEIDGVALTALTNFQTDVWGPASNPLKGVNASSVSFYRATATWYRTGHVLMSGQSTQTPVVGTGSAGAYHAGACLVCTLRTNIANRSNRGRMYLPTTQPNASASTLQWAVSPPQAAQMKTFFDHINATAFTFDASNTHRVAVVSQVGAGGANPVTGLRVDSVIDSQRNRSDKFIAASVATATLA